MTTDTKTRRNNCALAEQSWSELGEGGGNSNSALYVHQSIILKIILLLAITLDARTWWHTLHVSILTTYKQGQGFFVSIVSYSYNTLFLNFSPSQGILCCFKFAQQGSLFSNIKQCMVDQLIVSVIWSVRQSTPMYTCRGLRRT